MNITEPNDTEKVAALAPLQTARIGVLRTKYTEYQTLAKRLENLIDEMVERYSKPLDEFVRQISDLLERARDKNSTIDDATLQRAVVKLPILMYNLVDLLDRAAIESDLTKTAITSIRANAYLKASGTINEREAQADLATMDEAVIVDAAKHVYARLKGRIHHAEALYEGLKKNMSSRDIEKQVFGKGGR